tara:strand:- start:204 stop:350 length:147 start_codon:yes stop_codon:yes gene_type:complete
MTYYRAMTVYIEENQEVSHERHNKKHINKTTITGYFLGTSDNLIKISN